MIEFASFKVEMGLGPFFVCETGFGPRSVGPGNPRRPGLRARRHRVVALGIAQDLHRFPAGDHGRGSYLSPKTQNDARRWGNVVGYAPYRIGLTRDVISELEPESNQAIQARVGSRTEIRAELVNVLADPSVPYDFYSRSQKGLETTLSWEISARNRRHQCQDTESQSATCR